MQQVTETALLICNKGTAPSQLAVTSQAFCKADNKLIATEADKKANENIKLFGVCAITHSACHPAPIQWEATTEKDMINNYKILTEKSKCKCSLGGEISVQNVGHGEKHEVS